MANNQTNRRSGLERREQPPVCAQPCMPIKTELEKIYGYIKKEFKDINECIHKKIPARLYYWSFGGLCAFTVLVIGGFQWKILEQQKVMNVNIEVVRSEVKSMGYRIDYHIMTDDARDLRLEDKVDELSKNRINIRNP